MKNPRLFEYYIIRIGMIVIGLICFFGGLKIVHNLHYSSLISQTASASQVLPQQLEKSIDNEKDPYKLCKMGITFVNTDQPELALKAFNKATEIDPGYRDAWVMRGYAELNVNQPQDALVSLKKAEEIDPIFPRTYELLAIAYEQTGDSEAAKKAAEKNKYLIEHSD